jgi:hypothetical protein
MFNTKKVDNNNIQQQIEQQPIDQADEEQKISEIIKSFHQHKNIFDAQQQEEPKEEQKPDINNSNFGTIPKNETKEFMQNTINKKDLYISFNKSDNKFYFNDYNQRNLGSFAVEDIVKYITTAFDKNSNFMPATDIRGYNRSVQLIKLYIVNVNYKPDTKFLDIKLHTHNTSAFMSDIEMLMRLNNLLYKFEQENLMKEAQNVPKKYVHELIFTVQKFIYMLHNYTLQLIATISDEIKKNPEISDDVKNNMIRYSVGIVYRISQFVQNQTKKLEGKMNDLTNILQLNANLKNIINSKIDALNNPKYDL